LITDPASPAGLARTWGRTALVLCLTLAASCQPAVHEPRRLPTGVTLEPAGVSVGLGPMPLGMTFSPDSSRIVVVLSGYRGQGFQVVDRAARRVVQTVVQPAAFLGATFSVDGSKLYVSGGDRDVVYAYDWRADSASLADSIALGPPPGRGASWACPAALACSPDGRHLYVAENLADSLAVVDLHLGRVIARLPVGPYPYGVAVAANGHTYVSAWGGSWISTFTDGQRGLVPGPRIEVGLHPSALLLDREGSRLYVACSSSDLIAVVDARHDSVVARLRDSAPGGPAEGSGPDAFALSPDARRLYVAEADNDAVAVFGVGTAGAPSVAGDGALLGRIPVEWYPSAVATYGDSLWVLNGKGGGTTANPARPQPGSGGKLDPMQYTLGQTSGSLTILAAPSTGELVGLTRRVVASNGWNRPAAAAAFPPFRHVLYIIRENRSFDQVLGDLPGADGDTSLLYFPRDVTPNAHALAERFGTWDRFFVNGEVSGDGHEWCTAAYAADYVEKVLPSLYSDRRPPYDSTAAKRGRLPEEDAEQPLSGYVWDLAHAAGASLMNFGEFTRQDADGRWVGTRPRLAAHTDPAYPGWDLAVPDTARAAHWIEAFRAQALGDSMPALTLLWLPNDHTAGAKPGALTPRAYVADNDLALGRVIEALSRSRYWTSTIVFVLEDDAQDGPDHVDSHRSVLLVVSAWTRPGVVHRFANTTDVMATIDRVLRLGAMSKYDYFGRPLTGVYAAAPDSTPYVAIRPRVPLTEVNPGHTALARLTRRLDLTAEDRADPALFNRILWRMLKGACRPMPQPRRAGMAALGTR
jgi:YVTN family beta-propeller protein